MTTQTATKQAQGAEGPRRRSTGAGMRNRSATEVFGILEPSPVEPAAAVPAGLWKTGWLPQPEGAAS